MINFIVGMLIGGLIGIFVGGLAMLNGGDKK